MSSDFGRSRVVKAAFVLVAILAGKELVSHLPDDAAALRPFEVEGALGEEVLLRTGTVRLEQVRLTTAVHTPTEGYLTPGVWVVATASLVPAQTRQVLGYTAVRSADGERTWSGRSRSWTSCPATPPGVAVTCDLIFEVPPVDLAGADLLLGTETDLRHDSVAVIDLGITAGAVESAVDADPVTVGEARIGETP